MQWKSTFFRFSACLGGLIACLVWLVGCGGGGGGSTTSSRYVSNLTLPATTETAVLTMNVVSNGSANGTLVFDNSRAATRAVTATVSLSGTANVNAHTFTLTGTRDQTTVTVSGTLPFGNIPGTVTQYNGSTLAPAASLTLITTDTPAATPSVPSVSGRVTDIEGAPVVGATITFNGTTTTTTQSGTYRIATPAVPAGQASSLLEITASRKFGSTVWTGSNLVEVYPNISSDNVQIVVSDPATQGAISGVVRDTNGQTLGGVRVSASLVQAGTTPTRFFNPGTIRDVTGDDGTFALPNVTAGTTYLLAASYPGRDNATVSNVVVTAGATTTQNLTLNASGTGTAVLPNIANLEATAVTTSTDITRAANGLNQTQGIAAVKQWILTRKNGKPRHDADPARLTVRRSATRATPLGSNIDVVLLWDYAAYSNLYGYLVLRSAGIDTNFLNLAVTPDALTDRFSDGDSALTPNTNYYYSLLRLDTVNYAVNGVEPVPSVIPEEVVVNPLSPLALTAPEHGATVSNPVFAWTTVARATIYQVLLYSRFPALQSETDTTNGTQAIWQKTLNGTIGSTAYDGPALTSGATYYWTVYASDSTNADISISPIRAFIAR